MYDANQDPKTINTTIYQMTKQHRIAIQVARGATGVASTIPIEERRIYKENDNISHFICRLAYCRNEELRRWFLT